MRTSDKIILSVLFTLGAISFGLLIYWVIYGMEKFKL